MQNHYVIERLMQERAQEAVAEAALQALRRQALAARRLQRLERLGGFRRLIESVFVGRAAGRSPLPDR